MWGTQSLIPGSLMMSRIDLYEEWWPFVCRGEIWQALWPNLALAPLEDENDFRKGARRAELHRDPWLFSFSNTNSGTRANSGTIILPESRAIAPQVLFHMASVISEGDPMCPSMSMLAITRERILGARSQKESYLARLAVYTVFAVCRIHSDTQEPKVYVGGGVVTSEHRMVLQHVFNFLVEFPVISHLCLEPQGFQCCFLLLFRLMAFRKLP